MDALLRFIFGLESSESLADGDSRWEFSGMPEGPWLWVAVIALAASLVLIVALYRRENGLSTAQRLTLGGCRVAALLLIVLIILNPRIVTEIENEREGRTLVVLDSSASMDQRDRFEPAERRELEDATGLEMGGRPTRAALVSAALERGELLEKLAEKNQVQLFTFDEGLLRLESAEAFAANAPSGAESRLGDALGGLRQKVGNDPIAGVVVITDGKSNAGVDPLTAVRDAVQWVKAPIHAVGVGQAKEAKNFAVLSLTAPKTVEVDYPLELEALVQLSGIRSPVEAKLLRFDENGQRKTEIDKRLLTSTGSLVELKLRFVDSIPRKGRYYYRLQLSSHDDETTRRDNRREARIAAVEETRRVLLLGAMPTPEFRFVQRFFYRDDGIEVSTWLESAERDAIQDGNIAIRRPPATAKELEDYETIVLLDPSPELLTAGFREAMREFVTKQGGGLVYVASESNTPKLARQRDTTRFLALLPVTLDPTAPTLDAGLFYLRPWRPTMTPAGVTHPLLQLETEPAPNRERWERLPPFYFAHPTTVLRPSAVKLLDGENGTVIAAIHRAGLGQVLYLGTDDFWQWRASGERIHERFWAGAVRYLSSTKKRLARRRTVVETDRDRYKVGDQVRIMVHFAGSEDELDVSSRFDVIIEEEETPATEVGDPAEEARDAASTFDPTRVSLFPESDSEGKRNYVGLFRASEAGRFRVKIGDEELSAFAVTPISNEWQDPAPDFELLENLSRATAGSYRRLADMAALADVIPDAGVVEIVGRRASTVWDSAALMLLFTLFLVLEWVFRKLWNLN